VASSQKERTKYENPSPSMRDMVISILERLEKTETVLKDLNARQERFESLLSKFATQAQARV